MRFGEWALENKNPFLCSVEGAEGEEGGGTTTTEEEKPDFAKLFTEFSAKMEGAIGGIRKEINEVKKGTSSTPEVIKSLESKIADLEGKLTAQKDGEDDKTTSKEERERKAEMRKLTVQLEQQNTQLTEERARREAAETRQRESDRDRLIVETLTELDAIDPAKVSEFFRRYVVQDPADETSFVYKDGTETLTVKEGIDKNMAAWMKKTRVTSGGSGGRDAKDQENRSTNKLRDDAIKAGIAAGKSSGREMEMSTYSKMLREAKAAGVNENEIKQAVRQAIQNNAA